MILRRLTDALRRQDWFAVLIELAVVIVGIVLGLQFTEWNESRNERVLESYYLDQLDRDFEESLDSWDGYLSQMEEKANRSTAVAQSLLNKTLTSETRRQFDEDWTYLWGWFQLDFLTTTLDELRDTGRLTLIQSDELRQDLIQFNTFLSIQNTYNTNIGNMLMHYYKELSEVTRMKPGTFELLSRNEELLEEKQVYTFSNQVAIYQSLILEQARMSYQEAKQLHEKILQEVQGD
jgi:hypothetical protein